MESSVASSGVVCVAILNRDNSPLYMYTAASVTDQMALHTTVYTALDVVDERLSSSSATANGSTTITNTAGSESARESCLGLILSTQLVRVYGYVSCSHVKILAAIDTGDTTWRDSHVRSLLARVHVAYVDALSCPFHEPGRAITSSKFDEIVRQMVTAI